MTSYVCTGCFYAFYFSFKKRLSSRIILCILFIFARGLGRKGQAKGGIMQPQDNLRHFLVNRQHRMYSDRQIKGDEVSEILSVGSGKSTEPFEHT